MYIVKSHETRRFYFSSLCIYLVCVLEVVCGMHDSLDLLGDI